MKSPLDILLSYQRAVVDDDARFKIWLASRQVGKSMGMQKQAIHRVVKRWKGWQQPKTAPFAPGDVVLWKGKQLTVIDANAVDGTLVDAKGHRYTKFPWAGGTLPKKVGSNPRYLVPSAQVA